MSQLAYFILLGAVALLFGWLYLTLLYRFYKRMLLSPNCFGKTLPLRLINLVISFLFFPAFFLAVFELPFFYFKDVVELFQKQVAQVNTMRVVPFTQLSDMLSQLFYDLYNEIAPDLMRTKDTPTPGVLYVFLGLGLAVVLNLLTEIAFYNKASKKFYTWQELKEEGLFFRMSNNLKKNIAVALLLAGSLYLALCAIIAIPYEGVNVTSLDGRSKNDSVALVIVVKSLQNNEIADTWGADSAKVYADINSQLDASLPLQMKTILKGNQNIAKGEFDAWYNSLINYVRQFNEAVESFNNDGKSAADIINKKLSGSSLTPKLKYQYYELLQAWFDANVQAGNAKLQNAKTTGLDFRDFVMGSSESVHNAFPALVALLKKVDTPAGAANRAELNDYFHLTNKQLYFPVADFGGFGDFSNIPAEPRLGTDWGPLGNSASWLITAQSLDLVLIVGMFGFGLLGAAISSFVNTSLDLSGNKPLITGLTVVIVRGFSAAIIIFLATKGGIAIFNNGTNEPNPYVLFFTCLIGAVYSERIWDWAKTQLTSKLDPNKPGEKKAAAPAEQQLPADV